MDGLIDGLGDDLRVADGVGAVLVDPGVQGRHIHLSDFFTLSSPACKATAPVRPPKKASRGSKGETRSKEPKNVGQSPPCPPHVPLALP